MSDKERQQWISNDEGLYLWWKSTRTGLSTFVRENRAELDEIIRRALNRPPTGNVKKYVEPGRPLW